MQVPKVNRYLHWHLLVWCPFLSFFRCCRHCACIVCEWCWSFCTILVLPLECLLYNLTSLLCRPDILLESKQGLDPIEPNFLDHDAISIASISYLWSGALTDDILPYSSPPDNHRQNIWDFSEILNSLRTIPFIAPLPPTSMLWGIKSLPHWSPNIF